MIFTTVSILAPCEASIGRFANRNIAGISIVCAIYTVNLGGARSELVA